MMIVTLALALLMQATPAPPAPPATPVTPRPRVKVKAPEPPRWHNDGRRDDDESGLVRDTTFAVREGQRLEVSNFSGSIAITTWTENKVRVQAGSTGDPFEVEVGSVTVDVTSRAGRHGGPGDAELTLTVPAWMDLELSGNEVDIATKGTRGTVEANTVQGRISIDGGEGSIEATTVEGDVEVLNVKGRVQISTTEGQVTVRNASGQSLEVESVDGDIELSAITALNVSANTVDGAVSWSGTLAPTGTYKFSSHDGDVLLAIAGEPDATISIDTYDGSLESDWPLTIRERRSNRMTFTLGNGRARVELSSFDGDISLKRATGR
jgi:hypothetical protein